MLRTVGAVISGIERRVMRRVAIGAGGAGAEVGARRRKTRRGAVVGGGVRRGGERSV